MPRKKIVRWAPLAAADLEHGHCWLLERDPEAAQRFAQRIIEAVERLRTRPEMGPYATDLLPRKRYRHWVCRQHRIIYRVEGATLWILRVCDARQEPRGLRIEE